VTAFIIVVSFKCVKLYTTIAARSIERELHLSFFFTEIVRIMIGDRMWKNLNENGCGLGLSLNHLRSKL
jgi:hypothetical protein